MTCGGAYDWPHGTAMGHEYAGEVVALGAGHNNRLSIGDRVTALPMATCGRCEACLADRPLHCVSIRPMMGGFSEYTLIEQRSAIRLPQALSFEGGGREAKAYSRRRLNSSDRAAQCLRLAVARFLITSCR